MTKPDRFRWVGDIGIFHKQVGVSHLFPPGKISRVSSCRFRLELLPLMALWYPVPKLFWWAFNISRFCFMIYHIMMLSYICCADLMEELPWNTRIKYCGLSLMRRYGIRVVKSWEVIGKETIEREESGRDKQQSDHLYLRLHQRLQSEQWPPSKGRGGWQRWVVKEVLQTPGRCGFGGKGKLF